MKSKYDVYTDGSFIRGQDVCGYGGITEPSFVAQWNVGGEIEAVIRALEYAMSNGITELDIYHDYIGLSKWPLGEWRAKTTLTQMYTQIVRYAMKSKIKIRFHKVRGHSGNVFNDLADNFANKGRMTGETCEKIYYFEETNSNIKEDL